MLILGMLCPKRYIYKPHVIPMHKENIMSVRDKLQSLVYIYIYCNCDESQFEMLEGIGHVTRFCCQDNVTTLRVHYDYISSSVLAKSKYFPPALMNQTKKGLSLAIESALWSVSHR